MILRRLPGRRSLVQLPPKCLGFIFFDFFSNVGGTGCRRGRTPERPLRQPPKGLVAKVWFSQTFRRSRDHGSFWGLIDLLRPQCGLQSVCRLGTSNEGRIAGSETRELSPDERTVLQEVADGHGLSAQNANFSTDYELVSQTVALGRSFALR
jgi:hypothetical protein